MQFKERKCWLAFLLLPFGLCAQTTYLPKDAKENILIERLEIKAQRDTVLNFSKTRPYSRAQMIPVIAGWDTSTLSRVDRYNYYTTLASNMEWIPEEHASDFQSRRPILKHFYKTPASFYQVQTPNFFLAVNPVFQYTVGREVETEEHLFLNSRGVSLRGRIADKIGFSAYITDNQERDPEHVDEFQRARRGLPGVGFYKTFKTTGYDYFDARGSLSFNVANVVDVVFGYDKNFIGNGHRSLFLSDFSNSQLFLKLNTRIWKFNYQNIFMELHASHIPGGDQLVPKKYAAMHHLDLAVSPSVNIGVFEGVVFGREDHFEFGYLNPLIFYRAIEHQNGSFDNAVVGADFKANVAGALQFYGQFLLDEFILEEAKKNEGWWGNKWGYQLGVKYIDAFTIKNLDLQLESNRVRPFTYSHGDSVANYTHYNQPLAHPLGANFQEWIGIVRYQPFRKLMGTAKAIYYTQGKDSSGISYGSNIFLPNTFTYRQKDYGFDIGSGQKTGTVIASFLLSYELKPNLFIEGGFIGRSVETFKTNGSSSSGNVMFSAGVRWNMHRRDFDF
jgi:hypothetical protein